MKPHTKLVFLMFTSQLFALIGLYYYWDPLWLCVTFLGVFLFVSIGLECYLHRFLTHQSYTVSKPFELIMHFCSIFSLQGPAVLWAANHITHHKYADKEGDPHPASDGWRSWFWIGTNTNSSVNISTIKRLSKNKLYVFTMKHYLKIYILSILFFALMSPKFVVYFFLLPAFWSFHTAGFVTVFHHRKGYRNFDTPDNSRNMWISHFFLGSPLHNNHHANPGRYNEAVKKWEVDLHGMLIHYVLKRL